MALEQITRAALDLPIDQRLALADNLINSAGSENGHRDETSPAWETEIQNRIRDIDEGRATGHSFEKVQLEASQLLAQ